MVSQYNEQTPSAVLWLVDAALLDAFALHLAEAQQVSHNTVESRYNAVRTFLRVALRDNILSPEQGLQLGIKPYVQRRQRHEQTVGRRLSVGEVRQLRSAIDVASTRGLRDRAIIDCMLFAGLRRAEVVDIRMSQLQLDQGRYWLNIKGKGNKQRKLKAHDVLYKSLTAWQQAVGVAEYEERPLFVAVDKWGYSKDTQIDANVIERITAEYAAEAGLAPRAGKFKLSPHDLRRTCAKNAYDNGATLLQVQKMLGHSDPKTTAKYIGLDQDDDQTAVDCVRY
jgi:integrase